VGNVEDWVFYLFLALRRVSMELDTAILFMIGAAVYTAICCSAADREAKILLGVYGVVAIMICAAEFALK
jgi:hypothetical protein